MGLFTLPINECHVKLVLKNQHALLHTIISQLNSEQLLQRLNPLHLLHSSEHQSSIAPLALPHTSSMERNHG